MIIRRIKIKDRKATIYLDDSDFTVSLETYLNNNLLIEEEISTDEIEKIKQEDKDNNSKHKLIEKLSKKSLSKKECENLLREDNLEKEKIDEIIGYLENNYLISDRELAESIVDQCLVNKKGIKVIEKKFEERNIDIDYNLFINDYLDKEKYQKNIIYLIGKYKKMGSKKSKKDLKAYLSNKLIENGYSIEEFNDLIDVDEVDELTVAINEFKKFFLNKEVNNENIAKFRKKLLSKGFNYDIIKCAIRECEINETN